MDRTILHLLMAQAYLLSQRLTPYPFHTLYSLRMNTKGSFCWITPWRAITFLLVSLSFESCFLLGHSLHRISSPIDSISVTTSFLRGGRTGWFRRALSGQGPGQYPLVPAPEPELRELLYTEMTRAKLERDWGLKEVVAGGGIFWSSGRQHLFVVSHGEDRFILIDVTERVIYRFRESGYDTPLYRLLQQYYPLLDPRKEQGDEPVR